MEENASVHSWKQGNAEGQIKMRRRFNQLQREEQCRMVRPTHWRTNTTLTKVGDIGQEQVENATTLDGYAREQAGSNQSMWQIQMHKPHEH